MSDLFSKVRQVKPISLLDVLTASEQCWLGFRYRVTRIPWYSSLLTVKSYLSFIRYWTWWLLPPMWSTLHLSTLNVICHSLTQKDSQSKFDCNASLSRVVVTFLAFFISKFWHFTGRITVDVVNTYQEPWSIPLFTLSQRDRTLFRTFRSEQSSVQLDYIGDAVWALFTEQSLMRNFFECLYQIELCNIYWFLLIKVYSSKIWWKVE